MKHRALLSLCLLCVPAAAVFAACPSFVKLDVVQGDPSALPQGWVAFGYQDGSAGLYVSPLRNHAPTVVPGTQSHEATSVDISDDGRWICYVDGITRKLLLVPKTGGTPVEVPMQYRSGEACQICVGGFLRRSPKGTEVWGVISGKEICAVQVTLGESSATVGEQRWLLDFVDDPDDPRNLFTIDYGVGIGYDVSGDQILCRLKSKEPQLWRTLDATIPNNGLGTATLDDLYQYSYMPTSYQISGCGHTMSHDGAYCAFNPGNAGSTECVPQNDNNNGHKGFVVREFFRTDHAAMKYDEQFDVYAESINWAPEAFRDVSTTYADFTQWHFSNDNRYIAGTLYGQRCPVRCLWVVAWHTNTWYRITPNQNTVTPVYPAVFFDAFAQVDSRAPRNRGAICSPPAVKRRIAGCGSAAPGDAAYAGAVELYNCRGRLIGRWNASGNGGAGHMRGTIAGGSIVFVRSVR